MKSIEPKFSIGSLYICNKCGRDFSKPDNAEELKSSLRAELKNDSNDHRKIRVMVSGCLGVCEKGEQAFAYYPNSGPLELQTVNPSGHSAILKFIKSKLD